MTQRLGAAVVVALLLVACRLPPRVPDEPVKAPEPAAATLAVPVPPPDVAVVAPAPVLDLPQADAVTLEMLRFHDRVRLLSPPDLAAELARLNDSPASPQATLQLALLLGQTRGSGDITRAIGLLDPLLRSTAPEAAPWQPLARLLAGRYAEQRRLEEQIERQNQQARDHQRRLDQLNDKLEALKAIERSLTTRPPTGAAAPAGAGSAAPAQPPAPPKGPVP